MSEIFTNDLISPFGIMNSLESSMSEILSNWWLNQPSWKILVKMEIFPNFRGKNKKYLKPPPSIVLCSWHITMMNYTPWDWQLAPENWCLEDDSFPLGRLIFSGAKMLVSERASHKMLCITVSPFSVNWHRYLDDDWLTRAAHYNDYGRWLRWLCTAWAIYPCKDYPSIGAGLQPWTPLKNINYTCAFVDKNIYNVMYLDIVLIYISIQIMHTSTNPSALVPNWWLANSDCARLKDTSTTCVLERSP